MLAFSFAAVVLTGSAACALRPEYAEAFGLVSLLIGAGVMVVHIRGRLRAAMEQLATQRDATMAVARDLEDARSSLDAALRRHGQELQAAQAQLDDAKRQREALEKQALRNAQVDDLTKLPNRSHLKNELEKAIASAIRRDSHVGVMFLDIDDFKRINDTFGHSVGDELLMQAAERLSACLRKEDDVAVNRDGSGSSVARVGGDEFVLLLRDVSEPNALAVVAERLINAFRKPFALGGRKVQAQLSIGIACCPGDGQNAEVLLKHADMALYRAKAKGKDGFQFFSQEMSVAAVRRLSLENGLRKAIEENQFVLHFQPKVETGSFRITGVEALVRWCSPLHGMVSPASFISIAEETGLIAKIGEWVLLEACRQQRAWQDAGLPPIQVAVNVSALQFRDDQLLAAVVSAVKKTGIDPRRLQLEVTENLFMKSMNAARNTLQYVRGLGATVAIDDFGTGYSSFSYLRQLPLDALKIDRSFVTHLGSKAGDLEITRAIVNLARTLNVKTIAEGVETKKQAQALLDLGCNELQGFLFGRPVDAQMMSYILSKGVVPLDTLPDMAPATPDAAPGADSVEEDAFATRFDPESTVLALRYDPESTVLGIEDAVRISEFDTSA
jgi:diguanylate cyclase (GGDEF)-like protein